jgi:hypothetical protein
VSYDRSMKARVFLALASFLALFAGANAQALVLTFDDIPGSPDVRALPAAYGGVHWNSDDFGVWGGQLSQWPAASGTERVLFNAASILGGTPGGPEWRVTFAAGDVVFDGAFFATFGTSVYFNLYNDSTLVMTSAPLSTLPGEGAFLPSGYAGFVDEVGIVGTRGLLAMDDFTYEAVPEPAGLGLVLAGLAVLGLRRRRP